MPSRPVIYLICTGNAARSVMAVTMLRTLTDACEFRGAGTHSIEGLPMSVRTRTALDRHGLSDFEHRSHQLNAADVAAADLMITMEPDHVEWVRREHPGGEAYTATLRRLVRDLEPASIGTGVESLAARVAALDLAHVVVEEWETVVDPASGDQVEFDRCADELAELVAPLSRILR